jgi:hypothetical protein
MGVQQGWDNLDRGWIQVKVDALIGRWNLCLVSDDVSKYIRRIEIRDAALSRDVRVTLSKPSSQQPTPRGF